MRKKLQHIWFRLFSGRILRKIERDRSFQHAGISLELYPGIFHPRYFQSSQMLLEWVESSSVEGKSVIEVGAGSGITSLTASKLGAKVWAIDINPAVIEQLQNNADNNQLSLTILKSDLFSEVETKNFDYVLINPPFFPKNPRNAAEKAWYCGEGFEYFQALFAQLDERRQFNGIVMTLSDGCDLNRITEIASKYGYRFTKKHQKRSFFERNFLFEVEKDEIR